MIHHLKSWPVPYFDVSAGRRLVEVRRHDRPFAVGDVLVLEEWDPSTNDFTGAHTVRLITHLCFGFGVEGGYVALSITDKLHSLDLPDPPESGNGVEILPSNYESPDSSGT